MTDTDDRNELLKSVRILLGATDIAPTKDDLQRASAQLRLVVPYNYDVWRLHADLLLNAIHQLETRRLEPDESCTLFLTPLNEAELRNAAEQALRQCAHFADSAEKRTALVDEANKVRNETWF
jgi:hypothetical protein